MKLIIKVLIWFLKRKELTIQDRTILTNACLDKLGALPIKNILEFDEYGNLKVKGKKVETEVAIQLKNGADALKNNITRKIINEQRMMNAIALGVHIADTPEKVYFAKAALWCIAQEEELLNKLTGESEVI